MVRQSATINATWPEESRFHGEVLDLSPMLVVKLSIRTREGFFVYGVRGGTKQQPQRKWEQVGQESEQDMYGPSFSSVMVYPLHRGPSGRPRFLASVTFSGCAGSSGIKYAVEEWDPDSSMLSELLTLDGSVGMDEGFDGKGPTAKEPFHPIGKLTTDGQRITLPYCWFSALDWWDNPNMCAVETYDVSGDGMAFVGREYNRPELAPIAKALEYAGKHDLQAVRGYCASEKVARKLVRYGDSRGVFEDDITVRRMGPGRERVQAKYDPGTYFDVERRTGGWVITGFR